MLLFVAVNSKYIHTNISVRYFYHLSKDIYPCQFIKTLLYFVDEAQLGFLKMLKGTKIRDEDKLYDYK
jgi:hypothetical protein